MSLTQEQIHELCEFRASLSKSDDWLLFNLAAAGKNRVDFEDEYKIMQRWDEFKKE